MTEYDVMALAGHSDFATTHKFYLAVADDLIERAHVVTTQTIGKNLFQTCCDRDFRRSGGKSQQV
jgi:hypothetical protein